MNSMGSKLQAQVVNLTVKQIVFIAGGGRYGSVALEHLTKKSDLRIVVCDEDKHCQAANNVKNEIRLEDVEKPPDKSEPRLLIGDATESLTQLLVDGIVPKLIVPCVPFHFAAKVLTVYLTKNGLEVEPDFESLKLAFGKAKLEDIEYKLYQHKALVVASKMPFNSNCTAGCTQPKVCPVTGKRLSKPMYTIMKETLSCAEADITKILRSRLLAPSVGGFTGLELKQTLDLCIKKAPCTTALATSCACHAIANVFSLDHRRKIST